MSLQMIDNVHEWVEGIPDGWELTKLKHVVQKLERPTQDDDELVICTNKGTVVFRGDNNAGLVSLTENGYQGVRSGDLLVHGMDTWHGAIAVSKINGKCTSVVHVCDSEQDKRFLAYYLRALSFRGVYKAFSNGVRQNTSDFRSWMKAGEIPVILPPLAEQRRIAGWLDERCADIDAAVEAARASIDEYEAYKKSVISHAVTRGLDPDAPLKDTGIRWIGQIPAGWEVAVISQLFSQRVEKVTDADFAPLSVTKKGVVPQLATVAKSDDHANRKLVRTGDFAINSRSDRRNSCGFAKQDGSVSLINIICVPRTMMITRYFGYLFATSQWADEFYSYGHGIVADLWTTGWNEMKRIPVPIPPLPEQRAIAAYLDERTAAIDAVVAQKRAVVEDLLAYKKSLIYEAVTGKREV